MSSESWSLGDYGAEPKELSQWDRRYLELAQTIALWSKDPRKKVGAVITENNYLRGIGFNGFPRGIEDTFERLNDKDLKNKLMIHAEANALEAARGRGDTIYVTELPCTGCLGAIQQSTVTRIVTGPLNLESSWDQPLVLMLIQEAKLILEVAS